MLPRTVTDWSVEDVCLFLREFQVDEAVIAGVKASGIPGKVGQSRGASRA